MCGPADAGMELIISGLAGNVCTVHVPPSAVVRDVKEAVAAEKGIHRRQQRLLLGLAELRDDDQLSSFLLEPPVDLTLLVRPADQAALLEVVERDWTELLNEPATAWEDAEVVAAAVAQCGYALRHASPDVQATRSVVFAAVRQSGLALQYASPELQADRDVALEAVAHCGRALAFVAPELQQERDFVLEAVRRNGRALEHANESFRADRQVVLAAVRQCGCALVGASPTLRADFEVVVTAVEQDNAALAFASGALRTDPELRAFLKAAPRLDTELPSAKPAPVPPKEKGKGVSGAYFFGNGKADGNLGMRRVLGKQGAFLCEMANLDLPVAPGFCLNVTGGTPEDAGATDNLVKEALAKLEGATAHYLGSERSPLLLSVRAEDASGEKMDELTNIGLNDAIVDAWSQAEPRFVWDSYRRLILNFSNAVKQLDMEPFDQEAARVKQSLDEKCGLGRRHSDHEIPTDQVRELALKYKELYEEQTGEKFPQDPKLQLSEALKAVVHHNAEDEETQQVGGSAIVQAMVFGNCDSNSASGLASARFEAKRVADVDGDWLMNAQSQDVYDEDAQHLKITTEASRSWAEANGVNEQERFWLHPSLEEQFPTAYSKLVHSLDILSTHLPEVESLEFSVQKGQFWILHPDTFDQRAQRPKPSSKRRKTRVFEASAPPTPVGEEGEEPVCDHAPSDSDDSTTVPSEFEPQVTPTVSVDMEQVQEACLHASEDQFTEVDEELAVPPPLSGIPSWPLHPAFCFQRRYSSALNLRRRVAAKKAQPLKTVAAVANETEDLHDDVKTTKEEGSWNRPSLKLPVWQTALAGSTAGVATQLAARNAAACARAAPIGAVCCSFYVNLLNAASSDGNLDGVAAPMRLACAATAITSAVSIVHTASTMRACSTPAAAMDTCFGSGRAAFSGSLRGALAKAAPATAIEMCTIDLVRSAAADAGFEHSSSVLLFSGAAAGAVSQSLLCPLGEISEQWRRGASIETAPMLRKLGAACSRSMPGAAANSLVRCGLVSQFLQWQD